MLLAGRGVEAATKDEVGQSAAPSPQLLLLLRSWLLLVLLVDWQHSMTV